VQLRRRLGNGFSAIMDYTYSKSIDDAGLGGSGIAQNWLNLKAERALSGFDQRHLLHLQSQYTSGSGVFGSKVMSGWRGTLLKEWTFSGQLTIGSGMPLTPAYSVVVPNTGSTGSMRPSLTGASITEAPAGLHLNPAAYQSPTTGEWGNAGRNSITGPNQFSLNTSIRRAFRLQDRYNIEFWIEANNILNHATFPSWNTTINSSQYGLPDRANPMRKIQANVRISF
jgi:trimeric autotransporter adhesin